MFPKNEQTFYIIDGYGFIFRAFYALPHLIAKNGEPIGAVYGFFKMLITLINSAKPSYIAIALDTGHRTFRNDIYDSFIEKKQIHKLYINHEMQFFNTGLREEDIYTFSNKDLIDFLKIDNISCINHCLELGIILQQKKQTDSDINYVNNDIIDNIPKLFILMYFLKITENIKIEEYKTQYKANRIETPQELRSQFSIVKELIDAMEIKTESVYGYEADDVIASMALDVVKSGIKVIIVSSDKDLCQLVRDGEISVFDPSKKKYLDEKGVIEKFGIKADQIVDYLSIIGDQSDNVIGVKGIGPKGAIKLLQKYNHIEGILSNIDKLDDITKTKINNSKDWLLLAQRLIKLSNDAIKIENINKYVTRINNQKLSSFMNKYGFQDLDKKINNTGFLKHRTQTVDNKSTSLQHEKSIFNNVQSKESNKPNFDIISNNDNESDQIEIKSIKTTLFS